MEKSDSRHVITVIQDRLSTEAINAVDAHIESHATVEDVEDSEISEIYKIARPVLVFVEGILIFKPGWSKAIGNLIALLDAELPQEKQETKKPVKKKATKKAPVKLPVE